MRPEIESGDGAESVPEPATLLEAHRQPIRNHPGIITVADPDVEVEIHAGIRDRACTTSI